MKPGPDKKHSRLKNTEINFPLCVMIAAGGLSTAADVVDRPPGEQSLLQDQNNWSSLSKAHHDGDKTQQERGTRERPKFNTAGLVVW